MIDIKIDVKIRKKIINPPFIFFILFILHIYARNVNLDGSLFKLVIIIFA